ncbi:mechanosensitive ion channel domain-containing protein [Succinatimonas hippei]|uniref:mechanosensitive ion channel domain-containing protein n=1 Tax=Succinatimonas hippei TaxID=626938 RepID=UPI0023F76061|nr:mechanosensitive ion channel domain-containing protein [Succinatimonas hippei]
MLNSSLLKNIFLFAFFTIVLALNPTVQAADLSFSVINKQIEAVNSDANLSDEEKSTKLSELNNAADLLKKEATLNKEIEDFDLIQKNSDKILSALEYEFNRANSDYGRGAPEITAKNTDGLNLLINDLTLKQREAQSDLASANSDFNNLQTLPSKAQTVISENALTLQKLTDKLNNPESPLSSFDLSVIEKHIEILNKENDFLQKKTLFLTKLQDMATYKIRTATIKNQYYQEYLRKAQVLQNQLLTENISNTDINDNVISDSPALNKEIEINHQLLGYIDKQLQQNVQINRELHDVEAALETVKQIKSDIDEQINRIDGNLILSRLLNRQLEEIPNIELSLNLDELLPNFNLWLYDLRNYRDSLFDTAGYVNAMTKKDPDLSPVKQDLEKLIKQRKDLYDKLYQSMTEASTSAMSLKIKYSEFTSLKTDILSTINEHLFWLKSNYPLSSDYFTSFIPMAKAQLTNFNSSLMFTLDNKARTAPLLIFLIPLTVIALIVNSLKETIQRIDNKAALKLDKQSDNFYVTPLSVLCQFLLVIPQTVALTWIGALIVLVTIDSPLNQVHACAMILWHSFLFTFFIKVLNLNSLAQRHFSLPPDKAKQYHAVLKRIFTGMFPILVITNIREIEPDKTTGDILGYTLVLIASFYIVIKVAQFIKNTFEQKDFSLFDYIKSIVLIAGPLVLFGMIALGYYYTATKLINRIMFSFYICCGYVLVSNIVRRTLLVAEAKLLAKTKAIALQKESERIKAPGFAVIDNSKKGKEKIEQLRFEFINNKAFKLINIILLCITAAFLYQLWKDLTSALGYLNTVTLWSNSVTINGEIKDIPVLTLANIFSAAIIILITIVLYRNLPPILERIFRLRVASAHQSTSYTAKILTSYIITALGIICTAGALGLSWDKLQWLVAALSVGLGFGLQEIFANFVSGIIILFERQIRVGDIITINNLSGTVSKIRIRATTVVSFDNKEVVIPNREFITTELTNWSLSNTITMIEFSVGIDYSADPVKAKKILEHIVLRCPYLSREKPYKIYVNSMDASAITLKVEVFVEKIGDRKNTVDYLNVNTLKRFNEANINIPFNRLDVTILNQTTGNAIRLADKNS